MALPIFKTDSKDIGFLQTTWAQVLNPVIDAPINHSNLLKNVLLASGTNYVNTGLQRKPQGWIIVRQRGAANVYDVQDSNSNPTLTLALVSDANVSVDLMVF